MVKNRKTRRVLAALLASISLTASSGCNRELVDTTYGFENAVILNDGNSVIIPINKFKDYKGEAVQLITNDGMAILTSSYFSDLIASNSSNNYLTTTYAELMTDKNGTISYYENENNEDIIFNYQIIDFQFNFDKAIIIQNDKAVIIPVAKWNDYDGEQIQIITPENVTILASNYNTILISDNKSTRKAIDLAKMLVGKNGNVTDLAEDFKNSSFNKQIIDLKNAYNKAIILGDESNCILPLNYWTDYEDGEQFQIKVMNGPTYVCSSFNTILINDNYGSNITAEVITTALNENVVDYAKGKQLNDSWYNKQIIDLNYAFQNAVITSGRNGLILPLKEWCDYDGEQLQFILPNGVAILSSSVDSGMSAPNNEELIVKDISAATSKNSNDLNPDYKLNSFYNKTFFDTKWSYPYALIVNDDSILILSLDSWRDYKGGEQLQLTLADKETTLLTTAYDTKLVNLGNSGLSIYEVAEWFNDDNKNIVDLTNGIKGNGHFNYQIIDVHFKFNYAVSINNDVATIIPIEMWHDYDGDYYTDDDGNKIYTDYTEQLQITFNEGNKIYSDNTNIKLINATNEEIVKQIALGHLSANGIVNIYDPNNITRALNK